MRAGVPVSYWLGTASTAAAHLNKQSLKIGSSLQSHLYWTSTPLIYELIEIVVARILNFAQRSAPDNSTTVYHGGAVGDCLAQSISLVTETVVAPIVSALRVLSWLMVFVMMGSSPAVGSSSSKISRSSH